MAREPSLFARLAILISAILGAGAALLMSAAWYHANTAAKDAYDRLLLGAALQISDNLTVQEGELIVNLPTPAFEMLGLAERDRIFYRIVDPTGGTLTGYHDLGTEIALDTVRREPVLTSGVYKGEAVRIAIVARALSDAGAWGWAHVIVAQTTEARGTLTRELTLSATVIIGVMSLLALAGAMVAIRHALRPINRLGKALRQREPQNLTPVSLAVPRELDPLVGSLNHFMGRLDERMNLLQRFIADAAHQIRTPLTALSAQLDLLHANKLDAAGRQHLERVQQRANELARLTNQLLSHAMVIHRAESVQLAPVDLTDIARRAFRAAVPLTVDPDIVVSFEAPEEAIRVLGDAVSLREAIVNIIDNALQHGVMSRLEVRIVNVGSLVQVEVEDDGPGIPPEQWTRTMQRFETSRSGEGSAGLGFAIASEVTAAHGGRLTFRGKEGPGRSFTVILALPHLQRRAE